jgi:NAD(P) transhydrogenase
MGGGASVGPRAAFDLLVIGSGPAGQKAAIAAAKLGYRAAVVERSPSPGGVSVHSGTIPSKAMREAVVYLSGLSQRELYGQSYRVKDEITVEDLLQRTDHMVRKEADIVRDQLARNGVTVIAGAARFADAHTLSVQPPEGETPNRVGRARRRGRWEASRPSPRGGVRRQEGHRPRRRPRP